jgi:hypothetical protein
VHPDEEKDDGALRQWFEQLTDDGQARRSQFGAAFRRSVVARIVAIRTAMIATRPFVISFKECQEIFDYEVAGDVHQRADNHQHKGEPNP